MGKPSTMSAMWCRATLRGAHRYYQVANRADWTTWAIERMEDWSPTEDDWSQSVEALWIEASQLIFTADQAHTWTRLHDASAPEIMRLRTIRNSLAHLDNADFDGLGMTARKGTGAWSIDQLPHRELLMGIARDPLGMVFGVVALRDLVEFASRYSHDEEADSDEHLDLGED